MSGSGSVTARLVRGSDLAVGRRVRIHRESGTVAEGVIAVKVWDHPSTGEAMYHVVASFTGMSLGWHTASALEPLEGE